MSISGSHGDQHAINPHDISNYQAAGPIINLTQQISRTSAVNILRQIGTIDKIAAFENIRQTINRFTQTSRINSSNKVNTFLYPNSLISLSNDVYQEFTKAEVLGFLKYYKLLTDKFPNNDATIGQRYMGKVLPPLTVYEETLNRFHIDIMNQSYYVNSNKKQNIVKFIEWILYNSTSEVVVTATALATKEHADKVYSLSITNLLDKVPILLSKIKVGIVNNIQIIHVVTHNDVMQGFVANYLSLAQNSDISTSSDCNSTQSCSSISFVISRHAYSCNNALESYPWDKNFEPALTSYGILKAYEQGQREKSTYQSEIVFVSCLLRTWETAVLLYLPNIERGRELFLIVSPFLKETHGTLKKLGQSRGNYPAFIFQQVQLFHLFLSYCLLLDIPIHDRRLCLYVNSNFYFTVDIQDIQDTSITWTLFKNAIVFNLTMVDYMTKVSDEIRKTIQKSTDDFYARPSIPETSSSTNSYNSVSQADDAIPPVQSTPHTDGIAKKPPLFGDDEMLGNVDGIFGGKKTTGGGEGPIFSTNLWRMEFTVVCIMGESSGISIISPRIDSTLIVSGSPSPGDTITKTFSCNTLCLSNNRLSTRIQKCDSQMKNTFGKNIVGQKFTKRAWYNPTRYVLGKFKESREGGGRKTRRRKMTKTRKMRKTKK